MGEVVQLVSSSSSNLRDLSPGFNLGVLGLGGGTAGIALAWTSDGTATTIVLNEGGGSFSVISSKHAERGLSIDVIFDDVTPAVHAVMLWSVPVIATGNKAAAIGNTAFGMALSDGRVAFFTLARVEGALVRRILSLSAADIARGAAAAVAVTENGTGAALVVAIVLSATEGGLTFRAVSLIEGDAAPALPNPLSATVWPRALGAPVLLAPLAFTRPAGGSAAIRIIAFAASGAVRGISVGEGGGSSWGSDEGHACVAAALVVSVARGGGVEKDADAAAALAGAGAGARAVALFLGLSNFAKDSFFALSKGISAVAVDPIGAAHNLLAPRRRMARLGSLEKGTYTANALAVIVLARTDGGCVACLGRNNFNEKAVTSYNFQSTLSSAVPFVGFGAGAVGEGGEGRGEFWAVAGMLFATLPEEEAGVAPLWAHALPLSPGARAVLGARRSAGGDSSVLGGSSYRTALAASRSEPAGTAVAELLLVEAVLLLGVDGGWKIFATWVSGPNGALKSGGSALTPLPPGALTPLPAPQSKTGRVAYLIAASEGDVSTLSALKASGDVCGGGGAAGPVGVIVGLAYDVATDSDVLEGYAPTDFTVCGKGELAPGALRVLWRARLATCASAPGGERVLAMAKSDRVSAPVKAAGRVKIVGDDSLLLKYTNPHLVAVAVGHGGSPAGAYESARINLRAAARAGRALPAKCVSGAAAQAPSASEAGDGAGGLTIFLFDAISGRTLNIRRIGRVAAMGPVSIALHENWLSFSYWSALSLRTELGVATLYEGAMGVKALTPWSQDAAAITARAAGIEEKSSAMGARPPIVVHKTFVIPVAVSGLIFAATRAGVTPPALLVTTAAGGIIALDARIIDPRRPIVAPPAVMDAALKAEGLMPFNAFLPVRPGSYLNLGVPLHRLGTVLVAPTEWESTGLVVALGEWRGEEREAQARQAQACRAQARQAQVCQRTKSETLASRSLNKPR